MKVSMQYINKLIFPFCASVHAQNKRGPSDLNIVEICIFRTFSELKLWFIFTYEHIQTRTVLDFQLVSYFTNFAVQNANKAFVYITDLTSI